MKNIAKNAPYWTFTIISMLLSLGSKSLNAQHKSLSIYSNQTEIKASGSISLIDGFHVPTGKSLRISIGMDFKDIPFVSKPSVTQNYIATRTFKMPKVNPENIDSTRNVAEVNQTIQYFDGLGRNLQAVNTQSSPDFNDVVQPVAYDSFGREKLKYLPYTILTAGGAYRSSNLVEQAAFYILPPGGVSANSHPFSQSVFEASPLNRLLEQGAPGPVWQPVSGSGTGHTVKTDYGINTNDEVKLWVINGSGTGATAAYYKPGKLYKTITKDENWIDTAGRAGTIEEYKSLEGHVVLKQVWETATKSLSTYYVYDDLGNLRYVLPPAVNEKNGQNLIGSFDEGQDVFNKFIYGYHYDSRNRLIEKKIPGAGWEYMIYNNLDQLVASQDAVQRSKSPQEFTISKYDAFGRVILTGIYTHPSSLANVSYRAELQSTVNGKKINWESRVETGNGYTSESWPLSNITTTLSLNYFDDYIFPGNTFVYSPTASNPIESIKTKNFATGNKVNILGTNNMLLTVNYYDDEGRVIQTKSDNHLGGIDEVTNTWNFAEELLASTRKHTVSAGGTATVIDNRFEYDHMGRKTATIANIDHQGEVVINRLTYNEIGQLLKKELHSTDGGTSYAQTVRYKYNPRGWLESQSAPLFAMELKYDLDSLGLKRQFNGNVSSQKWGLGTNLNKNYIYTYDHLNRLKTGISYDNYNEYLDYDVLGNITSLQRYAANVLVDQMTYHYGGNQLNSVVDQNANTDPRFQLPGTTNYAYDTNGSMLERTNGSNPANNMTGIIYNKLKLPENFYVNGVLVKYTYAANGNKLKKYVTGTVNNDYIGGIHYEGGLLKFINTEDGRAVRNSEGLYRYEYTLSDHLGNGRVYFDIDAGVARSIQETDYYAFGLDIQKRINGVENKYQYNGKEKQDQEKMFDYGARFYDPVIGRFNVIDPLSETNRRNSSYSYALNNPIRFIDVDGMFALPKAGKYVNGDEEFDEIFGALKSAIADSGLEGDDFSLDQDKPGSGERQSGRLISNTSGQGLRRNSQGGFKSYQTPNNHVCGGFCNLDHKGGEQLIDNATNLASLVVPIRIKGFNFSKYGFSLFKFSLAGKYGFKSYKILKALTKGMGVQVHHLIEKRFAQIMGEMEMEMTSIVLTKAEHKVFTDAWRREIGHVTDKVLVRTDNVTKVQIENAARKIYADYPEILSRLGL